MTTSLWGGLAGLLLLVVAYLSTGRCMPELGMSDESAPRTAVSGTNGQAGEPNDALQVFFTTPTLVYPDVPDQRTPPSYEQAIIADLDAAQSSIDMAVFEYNLTSIADALIRAKERGVQVRLALDRENLEKPEMSSWAGDVEQADIPIAWEDSDAFLHSKFIIVDNALVWTGSWNATVNDTYRNNNNLLRFTIPEIVANYAAEFGQMFEGAFGNDKESLAPNPSVEFNGIHLENYFSPQDGIEQHILQRLNEARKTIRFLAFSFTSDAVAQALLERQSAGVTVQGVFENRNAGGTGAEFGALESEGVDVLEDGNCYTMHHKFFIIDDATVVTGSYNFTARAEDTNDENLLIIDNPTIAQQYREEFERVYSQAETPPRCGR